MTHGPVCKHGQLDGPYYDEWLRKQFCCLHAWNHFWWNIDDRIKQEKSIEYKTDQAITQEQINTAKARSAAHAGPGR